MGEEPAGFATIGELLEDRARGRPSKVMAVLEGRDLRYGEFSLAADRVAASLYELGVRPGDRVLATLPNGLEMLYLYFAVAKLGAVNVFVNPDYEQGLFRRLVESLSPKVMVLDEKNMAKVRGWDRHSRLVAWPESSPSNHDERAFHSLLAGDPAAWPRATILSSDPVQYIFTSGTTGLPKACILSHRARLSVSAQLNRALGATDEDRFFGCLPNYHGNVFLAILGGVLAGGSFALTERFSASRYWDQVRRLHTTILVLHQVPLNLLLKAAPRSDDSWNTARAVVTVGGKPAEFLRRFGLNTAVVGYGSTEAGGFTSLGAVSRWQAPQVPATYSGKVRDDLEVRTVGSDGASLSIGAAGEIQVRPRTPHVTFDGYLTADGVRNPPDSRSWYSTGDLGSLESDGSLHFLGRATDTVRVKGEFVPVEYLESLVREIEAVEECAVIGLRSELGDDDLAIFIKPKIADGLRREDVIDYLSSKAPRYMVPDIVEFVSDFPRSPSTLKIQKGRLRLS